MLLDSPCWLGVHHIYKLPNNLLALCSVSLNTCSLSPSAHIFVAELGHLLGCNSDYHLAETEMSRYLEKMKQKASDNSILW
jgi:hypothetical protein